MQRDPQPHLQQVALLKAALTIGMMVPLRDLQQLRSKEEVNQMTRNPKLHVPREEKPSMVLTAITR